MLYFAARRCCTVGQRVVCLDRADLIVERGIEHVLDTDVVRRQGNVGEMITEEFMIPLNITQRELAEAMGVNREMRRAIHCLAGRSFGPLTIPES